MRIMTFSPYNSKGLISIAEAQEDAPQEVVFGVPVNVSEARVIENVTDISRYLRNGISTKIKNLDAIRTIKLDLYSTPIITKAGENIRLKFVASLGRHNVDFFLSPLNFLDGDNQQKISLDFYYAGSRYNGLSDKRFIILEPNWTQVDNVFIKTRTLFSDWEDL